MILLRLLGTFYLSDMARFAHIFLGSLFALQYEADPGSFDESFRSGETLLCKVQGLEKVRRSRLITLRGPLLEENTQTPTPEVSTYLNCSRYESGH